MPSHRSRRVRHTPWEFVEFLQIIDRCRLLPRKFALSACGLSQPIAYMLSFLTSALIPPFILPSFTSPRPIRRPYFASLLVTYFQTQDLQPEYLPASPQQLPHDTFQFVEQLLRDR